MRAWLISSSAVALLAVACSGTDVSIGANDSGNSSQEDGATASDGSNAGQDTGTTDDAGQGKDTGVTDKDGGINPGTDGGGGTTDGGCVPKVYQFQCGNGLCNGGQKQYCSPYPSQCAQTPQACLCNYTCQCLLANLQNPCTNQLTLKCQQGGSGALYLACQ